MSGRRGWRCEVIVTLCTLVLGCTPEPRSVSPPPEPNPVALWDGGVVTAAEVRSAVRLLSPSLREQFDTPEGRTQFIDALVTKRLLIAAARNKKLDEHPEFRAQVTELEERLLIQSLIAEAERAEPVPSEAELRTYFDANKESFRTTAAVRVARVLVHKRDKPLVSKAKLERLRHRLIKGENVSRVAAEGDGAERSQGGVLGWLDDASSPLGRAALALEKPGQVSAVVDLEDAWACVVALEIRPPNNPPFEEVREQVASRMKPPQQRRVFDRVVKQLFQESGVRINPSAIE